MKTEEPRVAAKPSGGTFASALADDGDLTAERRDDTSASRSRSPLSTASSGATTVSPDAGLSPKAETSASPDSRNADRFPGAEKAAVFILSLEEEDASRILRGLSDDELGRVAAEIARLGVVDRDVIAQVMQEFQEVEQLHSLIREGGIEQATRLVERSFPREKAERILDLLAAQRSRLPFVFLERVEIETLMAFLEDEHPQTLAVILAQVTPAKAAEILQHLPAEGRRDVIERIAALDGANPEALEEVEHALRKHLDAVHYESLGEAGGVKAVADILRAAASDGTTFLDDIRQDQPELAEEIGKHLFVFDDLVRLDDRAIQAVLRQLDTRLLAVSLKNVSDGVKLKFLNNLSRRAAEELREEIRLLGPVRSFEVESAQRAILRTVLELEQAGQLFISGRGPEENRIFY